MSAPQALKISVALWMGVAFSLIAWGFAGYPWVLCTIAIVPLLAPLNGLIHGRRYTFAWATLFAVPYMAFAITELLANARARWVGTLTLLLVFGWFCSLVMFLRLSRVRTVATPS